VSPQILFVEEGEASITTFARALADQLTRVEARLPSGRLDADEASELHQLRGTAELMAAAGDGEVIHGGDAPWTVVVEGRPSELGGGAGRTVTLRGVQDADAVPGLLEPLGPHLQTVGVAGLGDRLEGMARALAWVGATRVVPFRHVAFPPPWWHHDGRGPLRDLVRWVDLETE
jgi:hypothetical protein